MALVLSLREGQDFYLDDTQVRVTKVSGMMRFELFVPSRNTSHGITDEESIEVIEDVFISAGDRPQKGVARVAIDAPRSILIARGDRYREAINARG